MGYRQNIIMVFMGIYRSHFVLILKLIALCGGRNLCFYGIVKHVNMKRDETYSAKFLVIIRKRLNNHEHNR